MAPATLQVWDGVQAVALHTLPGQVCYAHVVEAWNEADGPQDQQRSGCSTQRNTTSLSWAHEVACQHVACSCCWRAQTQLTL